MPQCAAEAVMSLGLSRQAFSGNSVAEHFKAGHIVEPSVPRNDRTSTSKGLRREPGIILTQASRRTSLQESAAQRIADMQTQHRKTRGQLTRRLVPSFLIKFLKSDNTDKHIEFAHAFKECPGRPCLAASQLSVQIRHKRRIKQQCAFHRFEVRQNRAPRALEHEASEIHRLYGPAGRHRAAGSPANRSLAGPFVHDARS
jgi:hypothetical protein